MKRYSIPAACFIIADIFDVPVEDIIHIEYEDGSRSKFNFQIAGRAKNYIDLNNRPDLSKPKVEAITAKF